MKRTASLIATLTLLTGCSSVIVTQSGEQTKTLIRVPAYPWQDSTKHFERLTISTKTNLAALNMKGFDETQTTSSNQFLKDLVGTAIKSAVEGAKGL